MDALTIDMLPQSDHRSDLYRFLVSKHEREQLTHFTPVIAFSWEPEPRIPASTARLKEKLRAECTVAEHVGSNVFRS
jgi:hypothetical protein